MDASGCIQNERALDSRGEAYDKGIEYMRSSLLKSVPVKAPPINRVTLVIEANVHSGIFTFDQGSEDQVIRTCRTKEALFQAHTLEKVKNGPEDCDFTPLDNFYPVLHKMLVEKQDWKHRLEFRGRASFEIGIMEWTESVMHEFKGVLENADIYGAVAVSHFPYHYSPNIWRAFLELWGPLTNTLHHGNGEMGITLRDLKLIGGLLIIGVPYEEFIPVNEELSDGGRFPSAIKDLLYIHSELCSFHKREFVYWDQWLLHFYRGELLYAAYGENRKRVPHPGRTAHRLHTPKISKEGRLAAFLAFWLSRFVLPCERSRIKPETFYMASLMAQGVRVSLAPTVLGYIYHGLWTAVTHPKGPGESYACFPAHYIIGWLGEYFPCLYKAHRDSDFSTGFPHLARYASIEGKELDISSSRAIFRTNKGVVYCPSPFIENEGRYLCDDANLTDKEFELLVCMRSALLPVRIGGNLWLEPYYPNRFARQFGFDQGVPSNKLQFGLEKRDRCCIEDLAKAQLSLYATETGVRFYIPRSTYNGACTFTYCRWWMRACAPYLGRSISTVYLTLTKRRLERKDDIFVIGSIREFYSPPKEVLFSEEEGGEIKNTRLGKRRRTHTKVKGIAGSAPRTTSTFDIDVDRNYAWHDDFGDGTVEKGTAFPPAEHANGVFFNGSHIGATRLKSVVVYDMKSKSQTLQPNSEAKHQDLEHKLRAPGPKKMIPVPKKHGVRQSSKEIEDGLSKPVPQEDHSRSPLSTFEPPIKAFVPELPPPVSESLQLAREGTIGECDAEPPLIGMGPDLSEMEPELLQLEWRPPTESKGTEPSIEGSSTPTINHSASDSDVTEPVGPDACEDVDEVISQVAETSSILHEIFSSGLNERWGDFIISEVEDILNKISLSQPLELIIEHRDKVEKSLAMLRPVIRSYGTGEDRFERFASSVSKTFEFANKLSRDMLVIEKCSAIDTVRIRELIRSHEECQHAKEALHLELSGLTQELADLMATEEQIIEAEQRAQQLRERYELAKGHLEEKIIFLKDSAEQQNKLDAELRQARVEANEDQLVESEHLKDAYKVQTEEFRKLVNSLKFFGETPD